MPPKKSATPATPNRGLGLNGTGSPNPNMGTHPADVGAYLTVSIHTAKCTLCNQRNTDDRMRRCPYCTWQICGPCREKKNDDLRHGINLTSTAKARRVPLPKLAVDTPKGSATPLKFGDIKFAKKEESQTSPFAEKLMDAGQEAKSTTPLSTPKQKSRLFPKEAKSSTPASNLKQKFEEAAQEATPPTSGAKRRRSLKPIPNYDDSDYSSFTDPPEDDEFLPESPTLEVSSRKRKKASTSSEKGAGTATTGSPIKRSRPNRQKKAATPPKTSFKNPFEDPSVAEAEAQHVSEAENRDAVSAYYGIDVNAYKEHPLGRSQPMPNRAVRIPMSVQKWNMPRKSAAEIAGDIQEKVGQNMVDRYGWPPVPGPSAEAGAGTEVGAGAKDRRVGGGVRADDHLRALPGRCKARRFDFAHGLFRLVQL